jgi:Phasin protein/N-6 DNA Methylase
VIAETGTVLVRGLQDLSREWLKLSEEQLRRNLEAISQLAGCRSVQDLVAVQSGLVRDARVANSLSGLSTAPISIYGVEKMSDTLRLCRMNLAVHGLARWPRTRSLARTG